MVVSTAITILLPYLMYAAERYLKVRLDEAARSTLDTAMRNGADWIIREGRLPTRRKCWSMRIVPRRMRSRGGSSI